VSKLFLRSQNECVSKYFLMSNLYKKYGVIYEQNLVLKNDTDKKNLLIFIENNIDLIIHNINPKFM